MPMSTSRAGARSLSLDIEMVSVGSSEPTPETL